MQPLTAFRTVVRQTTNTGRLLVAAKAAVAAALAWLLVPYIPFTESEYSFYAPLGALVSMYPTLVGSVRSSVQTLVGLASGIGVGLLGLGAATLGVPTILVLAFVVGTGVLLSGITAVGAGREWMPIAALFVLLLGRGQADEYSLSYLLNVGGGVLVGLAVNYLVLPPLNFRRASAHLTELSEVIAARLQAMADAIHAEDLATARLDTISDDVTAAVARARAEVTEAEESSRGNPRARDKAGARDDIRRRTRGLEDAAFFTRDLADVLGRMAQREDPSLSPQVRDAFITAIRSCADFLAEAADSSRSRDALEQANQAIQQYLAALDAATPDQPSLAADELTAAVCLERITRTVPPLR